MKTRRIPKITKLWPALILVLALLTWAGIAGADAALDAQLTQAAKSGDLSLAKTLLQKVNAAAVDGWTSVMSAGRNGNLNVAALLLANGANFCAKVAGSTALMEAAKHGNVEVARLLIEKGSVVNAKDDNGISVLTSAAGAKARDGVRSCFLPSPFVAGQSCSW